MICADSDYFLLELKPSLIPGAGLGVFAKADIDAGIILAEYRGAVFLSELESKINKLNNKCLRINNDSFIAGTNCIAAFVNDIIDLEESKKNKDFIKHKDKDYNCSFQRTYSKMFVVSTKPIKEGEELYIDYGKNYWKYYIMN